MPTPSDLLATLSSALAQYLAPLDPSVASRALEIAEDRLTWFPDQVDAWTLSSSELADEPGISEAVGAAARPLTAATLPIVIAALQRLDEWHSPLLDRGAAMGRRGGVDHAAAATDFEVLGRYNGQADLGSVVPKKTEHRKACGDHSVHDRIIADYGMGGTVQIDQAILQTADLMEWTTVLPFTVNASHQDAGQGADRAVELRYKRVLVDQDSSPPGTSPLRVMVAPVLEQESDVALSGDTTACTYEVRPSYACGRIRAIVRTALEHDVDVLLTPEMSLSPTSLVSLKKAISEGRKAWIKANGRLPRLAWSIAGVMDSDLGVGANHVVVLDSRGEEVARQEKISRWNMDAEQQAQFDLVDPGMSAPARMDEPIRGAPDVLVVDLPGLGRMTILICADMDVAMPGNWMFANAGLDLIYAPIMDKTTPVYHDRPLDRQPWIVRRSFRAAAFARARVMMTNSMPLTQVVNRTNVSRGNGRPPFGECLVGLLVDGTIDRMPYQELSVKIDATSPVTAMVDWAENWRPFDLPSM